MIKGVNFGNWLVLEKWMFPELFHGTDAEDETYLGMALGMDRLKERLTIHRESYIRERDFVYLKNRGINTIRIPVPFFLFEDIEAGGVGPWGPFAGCVEYLDRAFDWAEKYGMQILVDLHTAPGSQNAFDNGGLCGICVWSQTPEYVEMTLKCLERICERYGTRPGLWGVEIINEPISEEMFSHIQQRYIPLDKELAEKSKGVSHEFLEKFYVEAYRRMRVTLPEEKAVVFHDNFQFKAWKGFMQDPEFRNVVLDTHMYIGFAAMSDPAMRESHSIELELKALEQWGKDIQEMEQYFPVIVGEWCQACSADECRSEDEKVASEAYMKLANAQLAAWGKGHGWFFWNYKLNSFPDGWDYLVAVEQGHFPDKV